MDITPIKQYENALASGQFIKDDVQKNAVNLLEKIWHELIEQENKKKSFFSFFRKPILPQGIYMWGGVGRGKTWLMDSFYESLPIQNKMRMHFHHFMQYVHKELNHLAGQQNPLDQVAHKIHQQATVICFDEFFVSNVTDAMILGDLFQKLFRLGITLIATSNIAPDGLYQNGIHRDRFIPAIDLLKKNCTILNVDAGVDYRLRDLKQNERFKTPLADENRQWIEKQFYLLVQDQTVQTSSIEINHRIIKTYAHTDNILWCGFDALCKEPRSPIDFIEIAQKYKTVLVSDVPHLTDQFNDVTRRFIYLVDEFYDRKINLIITSADPILKIYKGNKLAFEIERTRSRLLEMQSDEYLN